MNASKSQVSSSTIAITIAAAASISAILLLNLWRNNNNNNNNNASTQNDDTNNTKETKDEMDATQKALNQKKSSSSIYTDMEQRVQKKESEGITLPAHLEREDWKERRRVKMLPHLAMKKPMYDNVKMLDPEGEVLCTISTKKGKWYVSKNLATWTSTAHDHIKLKFQPKNKSSSGPKGLYNRSDKQNICVSCGETKFHMRHYVVPYAYRTLLPLKYKNHLSHDIVILCPNCHLFCEQKRQVRMNEMEEVLRRPGEEPQFKTDKSLYHVRSCALALLRSREKMPKDKVLEYERVVCQYLNLPPLHDDDDDETDDKEQPQQLTKEQLQQAIDVQYQIENTSFIPGADLVVQSLGEDDEKIEAFIKEWRRFFLETSKPRFLPVGWGVDNSVVCGGD